MATLDRNSLLKKEELERVEVDLGKGESVFVRQMTGRERDRFEQSLIKEKKDTKGNVVSYDRSLDDFRAKLAICTVCDENGNAVFQPGDAALLSQNMSAKRLETIVNAAQKLNAITEEDKEALVKNSESEPVDNSNSDSVEN
jgi:ABC-type ATPase involved in cell division